MHRSINVITNTATGTTTTEAISIEGVIFKSIWASANASIEPCILYVDVSSDGKAWVTYSKLIDNVTNTISQNLTRVGSLTFAAASGYGAKFVSFSSEDTFRYVRFRGGGTMVVFLDAEEEVAH